MSHYDDEFETCNKCGDQFYTWQTNNDGNRLIYKVQNNWICLYCQKDKYE